MLLSSSLEGQSYRISTVAGGAPPATPISALSASIVGGFDTASGIVLGAAGDIYCSPTLHCVFMVDRNGVLTRIAGNGRAGLSGDGGAGASAQANQPTGLALDAAGNIYIADTGNFRIRKVSTNGLISTLLAGAYRSGYQPAGSLAIDGAGNVYFNEFADVRKVGLDGTVTAVAGVPGPGMAGFSGDGGPATSAQLDDVRGIALDRNGVLYIANSGNLRVQRVSNGTIVTIAGNGTQNSKDFHGRRYYDDRWRR